jgi:hypothetical protein
LKEFIDLQEKLNRSNFFYDLEKVEKMYNDYKEAFSKIGINTEQANGSNKDVIEVLTEIAKQLCIIQLKLYELEKK